MKTRHLLQETNRVDKLLQDLNSILPWNLLGLLMINRTSAHLIRRLSSYSRSARRAKAKVIKVKLWNKDHNQEIKDLKKAALSLHVHFLKSTKKIKRNLAHVSVENLFLGLAPDSNRSKKVKMPSRFLHHRSRRLRLLQQEIQLRFIMS